MTDLRDASLDANHILEFRRGPAADWTAINPVLRSGEPGHETDTGKVKIGDGTTAWTGLSYLTGGGGSGNGLPSTIVAKTASYTAAVGEFVRADTTGGSFPVTLPASPAVGALVAVKRIDSSANPLAVAASGGGTIDGDAGGASILAKAGAIFEHVGTNAWEIVAVMSAGGANGTNGTNGLNGTNGATWFTVASGTPSNATGVDGDYLLRASDGEVFKKVSGAWVDQSFSLKGAAGTNGTNGTISSVLVNDTAQTVRAGLDLKAGTNVTLTAADNAGSGRTEVTIAATGGGGGLTQTQTDALYAPQIPKLVLPVIYRRPLVEGSIAPAANRLMGIRCLMPRAGFLRDVSFWAAGVAGTEQWILSAYDTGDAVAGSRSRLGTSGAVTVSGGNTWQTWDPGAAAIAVVQGQQLDLVLSCSATTLNYGRGGTATHDNSTQLPNSNFDVVPGGASPKLKWQNDPGSFTHPTTVAEASCVLGGVYPMIIARIA